MDSAQRESRFKNQKDAAVKKKAGAEDSKRNGNDVVFWLWAKPTTPMATLVATKHAQTQIEDDHASLQNAGATRQLVELLKNHWPVAPSRLAALL